MLFGNVKIQEDEPPSLPSQRHYNWCPGYTRSQCISIHGTREVRLKVFSFSTGGVEHIFNYTFKGNSRKDVFLNIDVTFCYYCNSAKSAVAFTRETCRWLFFTMILQFVFQVSQMAFSLHYTGMVSKFCPDFGKVIWYEYFRPSRNVPVIYGVIVIYSNNRLFPLRTRSHNMLPCPPTDKLHRYGTWSGGSSSASVFWSVAKLNT